METEQVFKTRSCALGLGSCAVLATVVLGPALYYFTHAKAAGDDWVPMVLVGVVVAALLFFAAILPTMTYRVRRPDLILSCGPFRWTIPIASIRSTAERDLSYLPWSDGWKIPGYALFTIRYGDAGAVRMCATAVTKRILLIDTDAASWGITPADVPSLVRAIEAQRSR